MSNELYWKKEANPCKFLKLQFSSLKQVFKELTNNSIFNVSFCVKSCNVYQKNFKYKNECI